MANFTLDLSNYKEKVSCTVPDGRYLTRVTDSEIGESRKGEAKATVWLTIEDGSYKGEQFVTTLMLEGKGIFKTVEFLNALGQPTPRKRLTINTNAWANKLVYIDSVPGREFAGKTPSDVGGFVRYVAGQESEPYQDSEPMDRAEVGADEFATAPELAEEVNGDPSAPESEQHEPVKVPDEPETISLSDIDDL